MVPKFNSIEQSFAKAQGALLQSRERAVPGLHDRIGQVTRVLSQPNYAIASERSGRAQPGWFSLWYRPTILAADEPHQSQFPRRQVCLQVARLRCENNS